MISITKYEKARILGLRAQQLSGGAKPQVSTEGLSSSMEIAEREYAEYKIPLSIVRRMPDGTQVVHRVRDMVLE